MIGMIALKALPWKYIMIVLAVVAAFFYVKNMGAKIERAKWERKMAQEISRQQDVATIFRDSSRILANQLLDEQLSRETILRRLQDEARADPNAGRICLGVDSVMRLNTLGSGPDTGGT